MSAHEFRIKISAIEVRGWHGLVGTQLTEVGRSELDHDPLTLRTAGLMDRLVHIYDLIEGSDSKRKAAVLTEETLQILGEHLWQLLFSRRNRDTGELETNEVGVSLRQTIPLAGQQPPLRLSIEFEGADATLRSLPWEFLFDPERKWFLATKLELLLTRYVARGAGRAGVIQLGAGEKLGVLLVNALPENDVFLKARDRLRTFSDSLKSEGPTLLSNLDVIDTRFKWDQAKVAALIASDTHICHIVHVVGVCRGSPENPQMYLGEEGFVDARPLVEALTSGPRCPQLVILQLCDYEDGDATESFERVAPLLIQGGVPAVLALQYAADADQVGLGRSFYEALLKGVPIGRAVQDSRRSLQDAHRNQRHFGTPVLYLQEDGPLVAERHATPSVIKPVQLQTLAVAQIQQAMLKEVSRDLSPQDQFDLIMWVQDLDLRAGDVKRAQDFVRSRQHENRYPHLGETYQRMRASLRNLGEGNGDGLR